MSSRNHPALALVAAAVAFFMVILDTTVVNVALGRMQAQLGADIASLQWVVDAYALIFAGLLLTGGAIVDRAGARITFTLGLALFTLASALCGAAPSLHFLIAARIVQGFGAALLLPASLAALRNAFPDAAKRSRALGFWAASGSSALAAGPVVGGFLVDLLGWRSIFWINLPVGLLAIAFAWTSTPRSKPAEPQPLNLPANLLGILTLAAASYALIELPAHHDHASLALFSAPLALLAGGAFLLLEFRHKHPLIPRDLWQHPSFLTVTGVGFLGNFGYYGLVFFLGLFLGDHLHFSALHTGLCFLPLTASTITANPISGRWTAARGPRGPLLFGQSSVFLGLFAAAACAGNFTFVMLVLPLIGFGMGLVVPAMTSAALASVPPAESGIAAGILNTSRQIGGVVGVALVGLLIARSSSYTSALSTGTALTAAAVVISTCLTLRFVHKDAHISTAELDSLPLLVE